jgi:hypothetical protein
MLSPKASAARFSTSARAGRGRVVAARMEGLTPRHPSQGEPSPAEHALPDENLAGVLRTRGSEAAVRPEER